MKPEDVPDELVDSTAKAISQHVTYCDFGDSWRDCHTCRKTYGQVRSILSVALSAHEAIKADGSRIGGAVLNGFTNKLDEILRDDL